MKFLTADIMYILKIIDGTDFTEITFLLALLTITSVVDFTNIIKFTDINVNL